MSQALANPTTNSAEIEAWKEYRAAVMAMKKRPTQANARKAVRCWKRYFDEVMQGAQ